MNLRNGMVTVGELLQHPGAEKLFYRVSPISINSPVVRAARNMTLNELIRKAKKWMAQEQIHDLLEELKRL